MKEQQPNYYRVRAFPNRIDRYDNFMEEGMIAIGWSKVSDVSTKTKKQISQDLTSNYGLNGKALGLTTGYFLRLLSMKKGDIILIPYQNTTITIAKVITPYSFNQTLVDKDMAHTVGIEVLKVLPVSIISLKMKKSIDTMTTLISLDNYSEEIIDLLNDASSEFVVTKNERTTFITENTSKKITLSFSDNVKQKDLENFIKQIFKS